MRVVVDTNVLISALLKPGSVPDRALQAIWRRAVVLYDDRIVGEYRETLARPKFRSIARERIDELFTTLVARGTNLGEVVAWPGPMADEDDRIFVEVALAGHAEAIVTGNIADYPFDLGFEVLPPAMLLARLDY